MGLFFFKQKTAYEMRISDWSSDVCSSDLKALCGDPPQTAGRVLHTNDRWIGAQPLHHVDADVSDCPGGHIVEQDRQSAVLGQICKMPEYAFLIGFVVIRSDDQRRVSPSGLQIGRASCRERGCQYV